MNEIKTFVYRTEKACKQMNERMKKLKKRAFFAAVSFMALIALVTTVSVIAADRKNDPDEVTADPETYFDSSIIPETDTAAEETQKVTYTNNSKVAAEHKDIPLYACIEEDDGIMLLGIEGEESQGYIPAELGAHVEAQEEEKDPEGFESKIDEVDQMAEKALPPEDAPHKLEYTYNTDMMLDLDAENLEALERIVEAEACDQDLFGKMLVANVVINRVYAGFADTVKGVIFQKLGGSVQFSPVRKGGSYYTVTVSDETREAVRRVLSGEDYSEGAVYFFQRSTTSAKKAAWFDSDLKFLFKYGTHEFFKEKH